MDFRFTGPMEAGTFGKEAAQRVFDELAKTNRYDLEPMESVQRAIETLNLQTPVTEITSLLRLANELRVSTLVTGEVVGYGVKNTTNGRQAVVGVRVEVLDVASGLVVNGAAVEATSSVRPANTETATLVNEALETAAAKVSSDIRLRQLPEATLLNTRNNEAFINRGARDGFKNGQRVVIIRNRREQVATATIFNVEPDAAMVKIDRSWKGIQPGDRARVIYEVPVLRPILTGQNTTVNPTGFRGVESKPRGNISNLITIALVLGIVVLLLGNGRGSNDVGAQNVTAEPTLFPTGAGAPAVLIKWRLDLFFRNNQTVEWQIFRSDRPGTVPVLTVGGTSTQAVDTQADRDVTYSTQQDISTLVCDAQNTTTQQAVPGIIAGQPYQYEVASVYRISRLDLPGGGNGGTNTGGNNTTTTGGGDFCFFVTDRSTAVGAATPLNRPSLLSPISGETVINFRNFTFSSVLNPNFPVRIGYVLQFSASPAFPKNATFTTPEKISTGTADQSIGVTARFPGDTFQQFLTDQFGAANQIWWRIGARNIDDVPGPVPDPFTGLRYIFSASQSFNRPTPPPGP